MATSSIVVLATNPILLLGIALTEGIKLIAFTRKNLPHIILVAGLIATSSVVLFAVYRGLNARVHNHLASTSEVVIVLLACGATLLTVYASITYFASGEGSHEDI